MRKFVFRFAFVLVGLATMESLKLAWGFMRALDEVDGIYQVRPGQDVLGLGASCLGCAMEGMNPRFKTIWIGSSNAGVSVCAPRARLLEMERRKQLKDVRYCVLESCLFSYAEKCSRGCEAMTAAMYLQELPVHWRFPDVLPVSRRVYAKSIGRCIKNALANNGEFSFRFGDSARVDRPDFFSKSKEWQEERVQHYFQRDLQGYEGMQDCVARRLEEFHSVQEICRRNGVRLVVIFPPMMSVYRQMVPAVAFRRKDEVKKNLEQFGIPVFDRLETYPDELFFDPAHLSLRGAQRFSKELCAFIDGISMQLK